VRGSGRVSEQFCQGPSAPRAGTQNPRARKSRLAPVGM